METTINEAVKANTAATSADKKIRKHKRISAFGFALKGIYAVIKQEPNFRIQLLLMCTAFAAGAFLKLAAGEWIAVILCSGFVLASEAANSVIEEIVDWIHPDHHEKAGKIKDMAAAIPLIASIFSLIAGLFIFLPKIISLFTSFFK